ncbi:hypothetical protein C8J57DRAFT_1512408 [Mycena rebaudengoi]|nr:hypothetical protein C8J57DRAFT_1514670 [Mycena rebaudengoi]KAJ7264335.1 hypothetical protein C8J57DRAFT_1512408 [Mycena rebaudengoi]
MPTPFFKIKNIQVVALNFTILWTKIILVVLRAIIPVLLILLILIVIQHAPLPTTNH